MTASPKVHLFLAACLALSLVVSRPPVASAGSGDDLAAPQDASLDQGQDGTEASRSDDDATSRDRRGFGGPDQVDNTIAIDDATISRLIE